MKSSLAVLLYAMLRLLPCNAFVLPRTRFVPRVLTKSSERTAVQLLATENIIDVKPVEKPSKIATKEIDFAKALEAALGIPVQYVSIIELLK